MVPLSDWSWLDDTLRLMFVECYRRYVDVSCTLLLNLSRGLWLVLGCRSWHNRTLFQSWYLQGKFTGIQFLFTSSYEGHLLKVKEEWTHVQTVVLVSPDKVATMPGKYCLWCCCIVSLLLKELMGQEWMSNYISGFQLSINPFVIVYDRSNNMYFPSILSRK